MNNKINIHIVKKYIITEGHLSTMIAYMQELLPENADLATHPFEIGFLDGLIEIRDGQRTYKLEDIANGEE